MTEVLTFMHAVSTPLQKQHNIFLITLSFDKLIFFSAQLIG